MNAVKDFLGLGDATTTVGAAAAPVARNVGARNVGAAPTITRPMSAVGNLKNKALGSLNSTRKANTNAANAMVAEEATGQMGGRRRVKRRASKRKATRKATRKSRRGRRASRRCWN